jgi:hypothetical protein
MALGHKDSRRPARRAFQPTLDGRLETRVLMAQMSIRSQTAAGGQAIVVTNTNGQQFFVSVTHGTIQGTPASGGRVNLILSGSTVTTYLEINQIVPAHPQAKGAHNFNSTLANSNGILNIASITVKSGAIFAIEGYHTAVLSGPLTVSSNNAVNRIAFQSIRPGGSIKVGGDLDTLDVFNDANFTGGAGLNVGQDLNWTEIGGSLTFANGADLVVGRDLGLALQAAKGSGNGGQGLFVNGNLTVSAPSTVSIGRNLGSSPISAGILVNGNLSGASRFSIGGTIFGVVTVVGTTSA